MIPRWLSHSLTSLLPRTLAIWLLPALLIGCKSASMLTLAPLSPEDASELQDLLLDLETRYRLIDSLRTYMKVKIQTGDGTQEVREILRYAYPDKLRVDVLGALTETKAVILVVEDQFTLLLIQENEAIQDTLSDQVLTDIFGVDLRISDVRSALFANPFLDGEKRDLRGGRVGDLFRVQRTSTRPGYVEEIELKVQDDLPLVTSWKLIDAGNNVIQESSFQDYREIGGLMFPFKTVIARPMQGTTVTFQISQPELHPKFGSKTFELDLGNVRIRKAATLKVGE